MSFSCKTCGDKFDSETSMKIHHKLSHGESIAKEESACQSCGSAFEYYPSDKEGIYCSSCAEEIPWEWRENKTGKDHPAWNRELIHCSYCGKEIERTQYVINNRENHYCSDECLSNYRSENWVGKNHPNWRGGETSSYGRGWTKIRRKARERDNFTCQVCKSESDECYGPEVHHIKPVREFNNIENAHFLDNVICLCRKCHVNADYGNISRKELNRKI